MHYARCQEWHAACTVSEFQPLGLVELERGAGGTSDYNGGTTVRRKYFGKVYIVDESALDGMN